MIMVPNTGAQATGKSAEEEPPAGSALRRLLTKEERNRPCGGAVDGTSVFVLKGLKAFSAAVAKDHVVGFKVNTTVKPSQLTAAAFSLFFFFFGL